MLPLSMIATLTVLMSTAPPQAPAFEEQVAEYIRRYPRQQTYDYAVRFTGGDPARLNTWALPGAPALVAPGQDVVPRTNRDTYYQAATLWLEDGPVVISANAPSRARFNSFQLVDEKNANYRNILYPSGDYTLYYGERPAHIHGEAIAVPSRLSVVLVRVEVKNPDDPEDVAAAAAVFNGMAIAGRPPARFPQLDLLSGYPASVADEARRRMDALFASTPFARTVVGPGREPGRDVPYLHHAAGTRGGWGGPDPAHSSYDAIFHDAGGTPLQGRNGTYVVTTPEPPVDAFWSITVYDTERGGFLPRGAGRYHINNTLAARNADGSVTLTFKPVCEPADVNCLTVPAGRFDLTVRYFLPRPEITTGRWAFPAVRLQAPQETSSRRGPRP